MTFWCTHLTSEYARDRLNWATSGKTCVIAFCRLFVLLQDRNETKHWVNIYTWNHSLYILWKQLSAFHAHCGLFVYTYQCNSISRVGTWGSEGLDPMAIVTKAVPRMTLKKKKLNWKAFNWTEGIHFTPIYYRKVSYFCDFLHVRLCKSTLPQEVKCH